MALGPRIPAEMTRRSIYWINRTSQLIQKEVCTVLEPLGIDPRHYVVLLSLEEMGPLSQVSLSGNLNLDPAITVAIVDDLERRGAAFRKPDPADRRVNALLLTGEGRRLIGAATRALDGFESVFFGNLSEEERASLLRTLRKLHGVPDGARGRSRGATDRPKGVVR
jgi:DNA-binding MarR family transcriptional regulator